MRDSILWFVTLARKAGKLETGSFLSEKAVKSGRAALVIIAADCSQNTKKKLSDACSYYEVECFEYSDMESLARFCGKENVASVAVCDENFAKGIISAIKKAESK